jgi:hypothetical protein
MMTTPFSTQGSRKRAAVVTGQHKAPRRRARGAPPLPHLIHASTDSRPPLLHSSLGDAGDAGVGGDGGGGEGGGGDGEDGAGAAAGGAEDSSSEEDDDDIQVVLHQPEDEEDEGEEEEYAGEGGEEEEAAADGMADASPGGGGETPSGGKVPAEGATPGKSPAFTPNKKNTWVNPKLQGAEGGSGTPSSVAPKPSAKQLKALKARLGPLAHVPGGLEIDLSGEMPENIDIDSLQDKPWHKPDADPTDYFNYGFVEDTWRLYCRKQQEVRRRGAESGGGHTARKSRAPPPHPPPTLTPSSPAPSPHARCGSRRLA